MRQIILDTETTGRNPALGHRIIEIGALVIENREISEEHFHTYLNPERDSDPEALAVHGLSQSFLEDKSLFRTILDDFLAFLTKGNSKNEVIMHNAKFDTGFLDAEINRCNQANPNTRDQAHRRYNSLHDYCRITDSLKLARELHPNQRNSLDALCKRYNVDNSKRDLHGALLDAELLAQVYLKMTAGQPSLFDQAMTFTLPTQSNTLDNAKGIHTLNLPIYYANLEEQAAHKKQLEQISRQAGTYLWNGE